MGPKLKPYTDCIHKTGISKANKIRKLTGIVDDLYENYNLASTLTSQIKEAKSHHNSEGTGIVFTKPCTMGAQKRRALAPRCRAPQVLGPNSDPQALHRTLSPDLKKDKSLEKEMSGLSKNVGCLLVKNEGYGG